jgi:hypothetical protein
MQKWINLADLSALHNFTKVVLDKCSVLLPIQLEDVLEEYLERVISIHFEAPDYLRLETEILAQHEVIRHIEFRFLQNSILARVVLYEHVHKRGLDLFG